MRARLVFLFIILLLLLASCNRYPDKVQKDVISSNADNLNIKELPLTEEAKIDMDNNGSLESIRLYTFYNEENNTYEIKLSVDGKSIDYRFEFPTPFNRVEKMQFINLNNNKAILIKLYDINNQESFVKANASSYEYDYGVIVFGMVDDKIAILLDSNKMPFKSKNNYQIDYLGGYTVKFTDKAASFIAEYNIYYSDALKDEYKKRLEMLEDFAIAKGMEERSFYQIAVEDIGLDGIDEIVCSKLIPGIYHNDVLGIIDYYYILENNKYALSKEVLSYNKVLELPPIKEMHLKK